MTTINWTEVLASAKTASFNVIPKGDYHIKVEEPNATTASTGKPMIKLRARVMVGPHARASLLTQQVMTLDNPQALAIFIKFLKAFGIGEEWLAQLGTTQDLTPVAQVLDGREAIAVVDIGTWQDEPRNEIKRFKPLTAGLSAVPTAVPGVPVMPGVAPQMAPVIPMPGIGAPGSVAQPVPAPPPPPMPVSVPAPPPAPAAAAPAPPAPPAPASAPVPPPPPAPAPQAAPQPPQPPVPAPVPAPVAAPAPAAPAFDFASLSEEDQQRLMAQFAAQQAATSAPAPVAAGPAIVAPDLPY